MGLDFDHELSFQEIEEAQARLSLNGGICARFGGIQISAGGERTKILAWQCNMADVQNFDVRLPAVVEIILDSRDKIESIELKPNFKGSQGIICSGAYIGRRLQKVLTGEELSSANVVVNNPCILHCRHTYELVYGAACFLENVRKNGDDSGLHHVAESTVAYSNGSELECFDEIEVDGRTSQTKICIGNLTGNIEYDRSGKVINVQNISIRGFTKNGPDWTPVKKPVSLSASGNKEYNIKLMKLLSPYWRASGKKLRVKTKFHFSQIWAPTFFGILSQALGLVIFNNNYAYFQHCIYGIQRTENHVPLCIGVSDDISDAMNHFKDFSIEDI